MENITPTLITFLRTFSSVSQLLVVRLGGSIVNLCVFYSYKLIGKLTVFLKVQEFSLKVGNTLVRTVDSRVNLNLHGSPITSRTHQYSPITLGNISSINLVSVFRCSSPPINPVYTRRVDPLTFSSFQSFIVPTIIYQSSLYLSFYRFIINKLLQIPVSNHEQFHYRRTTFSSQLKSKVRNILDKVTVRRITLNIDGSPITSKSHTHPSHNQTSRLLTSSLS